MTDGLDWLAVSSSGTPPATESRPAAPRDARAADQGAVGLAPERLTEALEMLREVADSLTGVRAQLAEAQHATVTGTSSGRHVSVVRARSGSGLTVKVDERWLDAAHERAVSQELLEALQAAHDAAMRPAQVFDADGPLGRLQALTASPASLLAWVGLPPPKA